MRALCGAIIVAGAMLGLGLVCIAIGIRYQDYPYLNLEGKAQWVLLRHVDTALLVGLTISLLTLVIGLGIAFLGLAYHHQRRYLESMHYQSRGGERSPDRLTV